jgi:hypothetical protein
MARPPPPLDELSPFLGDQERRGAIRQMKALSDPVSREIDTIDHLGQFASKPDHHLVNQHSK